MSHINTSAINSDISAIECTADNCSLEVEHTDDCCAGVQFTRGVSAYIKKGEGKLIIKQKKGLLSRIFGSEVRIKIFVPGHIVPALSIKGGNVDAKIDGGIYSDAEFSAASGSFRADGASMESLTINTSACNAILSKCTIKGNLVASIEDGELSLEYTFATHIASRIKKGNAGAVELNCRNTIWEVTEGNITATVLGAEQDFNLSLAAKEGTCNRQNRNSEDSSSSLKAYVVKGNIFIDFIDTKESV